jgi:Tol biopolymer transport system component
VTASDPNVLDDHQDEELRGRQTVDKFRPYVGPRSFRPDEGMKFYGRAIETRDLKAMIVSHRLILFHAPSGAGKSSLLNTKIRTVLTAEGFEVLPYGRVSGFEEDKNVANIYVYNLLLSLQGDNRTSVDCERLPLADFLDNFVRHSDGQHYYDAHYLYAEDAEFRPRVLIIDQFEELFTTHSALWQQRADFFKQLSQALSYDEQLRVVLTMRDDYVARLERYSHLTPNRLRHRYYMDRLTRDTALEAITLPVENMRKFEADAAEKLVDNLLAIHDDDPNENVRYAQFVEPVQLQAVCYQLWEKLRNRPGKTITVDDVERFADVDTALINFYEETIKATVHMTAVSETDLRTWFDRELITEAGTRNMVFRGEAETGSLPTEVADAVRKQFILSEVVRPGGIWYELVHDRFVGPIVSANNAWRQEQPLIQLAMQWDALGRPRSRLLSGLQLAELKETQWKVLGPVVVAYIEAGQQAAAEDELEKREQQQKLAEQNHALAAASKEKAHQARKLANERARSAHRLRYGLAAAMVLLLVALIGIYNAFRTQGIAEDARGTAEAETTRAHLDREKAYEEIRQISQIRDEADMQIAQLDLNLATRTEALTRLSATATSERQAVESLVSSFNLTLTPTPSPIPATPTTLPTSTPVQPRDTSQIAFSGIVGGSPNLLTYRFSANRIGHGQVELLSNDAHEQQDPAWSCDGRLAYVRYDKSQNSWALVVRDERIDREVLESSHAIRRPSWSPDGETLAFDWGRNDNHDIYTIPVLSPEPGSPSEPKQWTSHVSDDLNPSYSPDGQALTFYSLRDGNREIYVLNLTTGGQPIRLTYQPGDDQRPTWSPNPDDQWIAFDSARDGNWNVYVMRPDGSQVTQLTTHEEYDWSPAWSHDGRQLAFLSERTGFGRWQIFVMDFDMTPEKSLVQVTNEGHVLQPLAPDWQPQLNSCHD